MQCNINLERKYNVSQLGLNVEKVCEGVSRWVEGIISILLWSFFKVCLYLDHHSYFQDILCAFCNIGKIIYLFNSDFTFCSCD